ncbi:hypothetical protein PILCRDRAFT_823003 [Piloderma croceum F 1598]|uniref:Uncharacterized protein n=1 Tax=Piloderma croceum (strain F 1598) TaxID=765440 RepID=A0A0C3F533_PILCF|nr:hypothetical protein PILCRDRAFT_823003 [Piloderma croceum F 1598]
MRTNHDLWCDFSTFIIRDRGRVDSESRFVFGRVVLSASLLYLLDGSSGCIFGLAMASGT